MRIFCIVAFAMFLLLACGCDIIGIDSPLENKPPDAYIDAISPEEAETGDAVSFLGHGTDADGTVVGYRWRSDKDGDLSTLAEFDSSSLSEGEHVIYFKVQDNNGAWSSEVRRTITIGPGSTTSGLPVINTFSVSPASAAPGAAVTLKWTVSGADTVHIDGGVGDVSASGSAVVFPAITTTYNLTAANTEGTANAATTVTVSGSIPAGYPVINSFIATPNVIAAGDAAVLSWDVTGATEVTITPGIGSVATSGSSSVSPAVTTSYTLTATNNVGFFTMTITVVVSGSVADSTPPGVPVLITPVDGDVMPQPVSPWAFDWEDAVDAESGINQYHLYVIHLGAAHPVIDQKVAASEYTTTIGGAVNSGYLTDWTWKVRAQNNEGLWSDWSAVNTFSVAPKLVTVTLSPVAVETGSITKGGTVASTVLAGDNASNKPIRAYYSYDISSLAGKEITSASVSFITQTILNNPWPDLTGLWVAQVNYTGPLEAGYYSLSGTPVTGSYLSNAPGTMNVTSQVASAAGSSANRFQLRLHFSKETDGDNSADYIMFSNATLKVTYVQ